MHPRTLVFLKNGCSCLPERLFFSKMVVRASPNACFSQKRLFRTCRTLVFLKNGCSAPAERLFFSKTIVPTPWNVRFSQNQLFQPLGMFVFLKNDCSNPLEHLFFSKPVVPTPWNGRPGCFKTKRACPNGHALSVSVIKECVLLFTRQRASSLLLRLAC